MTEGLLNVELGPGEFPEHPEYISVDYDAHYNPNYVCDFSSQKLPFADDAVDTIYAKFVLEHLDQQGIIFLMKEIYRVLNKNGFAEIIVPHFRNPRSIDIFHKSLFSHESFRYWDHEKSYKFASLHKIGPFPPFHIDVIFLPDDKYIGECNLQFVMRPVKS